MYIPKYFKAYELVDKKTYDFFKDMSFQFFDEKILMSLDILREQFGALTVNDWYFGGQYDSRGLRSPTDKTGSLYSLHRFGKAIDCVSKKYTAEEMRDWIRKHPHTTSITAIEKNVNWLHIDCRNIKPLLEFVI